MAALHCRARQVQEMFSAIFAGAKAGIRLVRAPGRVNLIGEHTDYNDGFVLPVAIDRDIIMAARPRSDGQVEVYAMDLDARSRFGLDDIQPDPQAPWSNYIRGVLLLLQRRGLPVQGMDIAFSGNVPLGAGLSSSAALEMATGIMAKVMGHFEIEMVELVKVGQAAENSFVGVNCGIMDQFISGLGRQGHALFLDCRSLDYELVPLPATGDYKIVIANTTVKRGLVDSAYNERRQQCEEGARVLGRFLPGVSALRDVTPEEFHRYRGHLSATVQKRCMHVIWENQRVLHSVEALRGGDIGRFGQLMAASHHSLRDLYEVSSRELDTMVEAAAGLPMTIGTRMTGAGFGGCTVSLVEAGQVEDFMGQVGDIYTKATGLIPEFYVCQAASGAGELQL